MQTGQVVSPPARKQRGASLRQQIRKTLLKKLWLPRIVYEILPYAYMALGLIALVSAAFAPDWTWILPYAILLGLACLHIGLALVALRYRFRKRNGQARN